MISSKSISRTPSSTVSATTIVSSLLTVQTDGAGFTDLSAEAELGTVGEPSGRVDHHRR